MIKTEMMKQYEKETGETLDMAILAEDASGSWYGFLDMMNEKAAAYGRIMSGGKKTLKEMSNFLGKIVVVHRDGRASWHEILPNKNEQWGIWVVRSYKDNHGDIPKDLILFDGDWQDSLTLPDGWEDTDEN